MRKNSYFPVLVTNHFLFTRILLFIHEPHLFAKLLLYFTFRSGLFLSHSKFIADRRYHDLTSKPNLNWLIHMLYARQDYKQCLSVIEHQFSEAYDHEYLYFVKVWAGVKPKAMSCICLVSVNREQERKLKTNVDHLSTILHVMPAWLFDNTCKCHSTRLLRFVRICHLPQLESTSFAGNLSCYGRPVALNGNKPVTQSTHTHGYM